MELNSLDEDGDRNCDIVASGRASQEFMILIPNQVLLFLNIINIACTVLSGNFCNFFLGFSLSKLFLAL